MDLIHTLDNTLDLTALGSTSLAVSPIKRYGSAGVSLTGTAGSIGFSYSPVPLISSWTNIVGVTASGSSVWKASGVDAWDSGARSSISYSSGDLVVSAEAGYSSGVKRMLGIGVNPDSASYADIEFAVYANSSGGISVYENGAGVYSGGSYLVNDVFTVLSRKGYVYYYYKNTLIYTSSRHLGNGPFYADLAFAPVNSRWNNIRFGKLYEVSSTDKIGLWFYIASDAVRQSISSINLQLDIIQSTSRSTTLSSFNTGWNYIEVAGTSGLAPVYNITFSVNSSININSGDLVVDMLGVNTGSIYASDVNSLRTRINAERLRRGLSNYLFSTAVANTTKIMASDISDLRVAITPLASAYDPFVPTNATVLSGSPIKYIDYQDIVTYLAKREAEGVFSNTTLYTSGDYTVNIPASLILNSGSYNVNGSSTSITGSSVYLSGIGAGSGGGGGGKGSNGASGGFCRVYGYGANGNDLWVAAGGGGGGGRAGTAGAPGNPGSRQESPTAVLVNAGDILTATVQGGGGKGVGATNASPTNINDVPSYQGTSGGGGGYTRLSRGSTPLFNLDGGLAVSGGQSAGYWKTTTNWEWYQGGYGIPGGYDPGDRYGGDGGGGDYRAGGGGGGGAVARNNDQDDAHGGAGGAGNNGDVPGTAGTNENVTSGTTTRWTAAGGSGGSGGATNIAAHRGSAGGGNTWGSTTASSVAGGAGGTGDGCGAGGAGGGAGNNSTNVGYAMGGAGGSGAPENPGASGAVGFTPPGSSTVYGSGGAGGTGGAGGAGGVGISGKRDENNSNLYYANTGDWVLVSTSGGGTYEVGVGTNPGVVGNNGGDGGDGVAGCLIVTYYYWK